MTMSQITSRMLFNHILCQQVHSTNGFSESRELVHNCEIYKYLFTKIMNSKRTQARSINKKNLLTEEYLIRLS